jgi:cell division protein FtsQ
MELAEKKYNKIIASRKRRLIRRRIWGFFRIFFIILFLIGLVWGFNYLYNSSYFKISSIIIENNSHYSSELINKEANLAVGKNIFEVDKKNIEEELLKKFIWLKSVTLKKIFPDKVIIDVIERKPFEAILAGGNYFLIDSEGIVLEKLDEKSLKNYKDLILVRNALKYSPEIGEKIAKKNILSCGEIYQSLDMEVKKEIKESMIENNFTEDIVFLTYSGKKIIFGDNDKIIEKNAILKQILKQLSEQNIYYSMIDLRNIENPIIK